MSEQIAMAVTGIVAGLLGWSALRLKNQVRDAVDRRKVYRWLRSNTRDEPGESHVNDLRTVSKGTRLPEERVLRACMSDERIHRFPNDPDRWSVWRKEPQSVYEKRGLLVL
jgi:hypothetical protein